MKPANLLQRLGCRLHNRGIGPDKRRHLLVNDFIVDQVSLNYEYQVTYHRFLARLSAPTQVGVSCLRATSAIAPTLKCGFRLCHTSRVEDFNFEGRE